MSFLPTLFHRVAPWVFIPVTLGIIAWFLYFAATWEGSESPANAEVEEGVAPDEAADTTDVEAEEEPEGWTEVPEWDRYTVYTEALALADDPETLNRARAAMRRLAPIDVKVPHQAGYADAHVWMVRDLVKTVQERLKEGMVASELDEGEQKPRRAMTHDESHLVASHLRRAISLDPTHSEAHELMALYLAQTGRLDEAIILLEGVVDQLPDLRLWLAYFLTQKGDAGRAKTAAEDAAVYLRELAVVDNDPMQRLRWAQAELIRGNHESALAITARGAALFPEDKRFQELDYQVWLDKTNKTLQAGDAQAALAHLKEALQIDPLDARAVPLLGRLCVTPESRGEARALLTDMERAENAPAAAHALMGDLRAHAQAFSEAIQRYEKAIATDPEIIEARNNLALCLIHIQPPNFPRALEVIEEAIQLHDAIAPNQPKANYLESKGQILSGMNRPQEAIAAFELSLKGIVVPEVKSSVHGRLASLYASLGMDELAKSHRAQAQSQ